MLLFSYGQVSMVDRVSSSLSRIPVPLKSPVTHSLNGTPSSPAISRGSPEKCKYHNVKTESSGSNSDSVAYFSANSAADADASQPGSAKKEKGFETFVMTGDMIIKTTSPPKSCKSKLENSAKKSPTPKLISNPKILDSPVPVVSDSSPSSAQDDHSSSVDPEPLLPSSHDINMGIADKNNSNAVSPVLSSVVDSKETLSSGSFKSSDSVSSSSVQSVTEKDAFKTLDDTGIGSADSFDSVINKASVVSEQVINKTQTDSSRTEPLTVPNSSEPSNGEYNDDKDTETVHHDGKHSSSIVCSKSAEKITFSASRQGQPVVRPSKSHENYLQGSDHMMLVDIDIDDEMAYSMDLINYQEGLSTSSLDRINGHNVLQQEMSKSLQSSPERKNLDKQTDRIFMPGFISLEEPKISKAKGKENRSPRVSDQQQTDNLKMCSVQGALDTSNSALENASSSSSGNPSNSKHMNKQTDVSTRKHKESDVCDTVDYSNPVQSLASSRIGAEVSDKNSRNPDFKEIPNFTTTDNNSDDLDFIDLESAFHQPNKDVDRPSAARLAKRLFQLDGFRKSDVSRHLCKKNEFSTLVAEEYLSHFEFTADTLDSALRKFLVQFCLIGETQERERVLAHFSQRYIECNPGSYYSEDSCHTLTCAIMLLNTDLHNQNVARKMTCSEFIENLAELNDGDNFPKESLKALYIGVKTEPIEWAMDDDISESDIMLEEKRPPMQIEETRRLLGNNPFLNVPDPSKSTEYKKGFVMRKCCMGADRRRTPFGKRGWKMFYATLRDMIFYLYKNEIAFKKGTLVESSSNAIRIHHAIVTKASDYTKKQHVFRLHSADGAEYLFQTSNSKELQEWIDTLNLVAATLSAPPLPGAVGSQVKFQRPLMPSSYTHFNQHQQLMHHEDHVLDLEREIQEHRLSPPEKGCKTRVINDYLEKEHYLQFELKRFKTYTYLLQSKLMTYGPDADASLAETVIGEVDEAGSPVSDASPLHSPNSERAMAQRSLSDSCPPFTVNHNLHKTVSMNNGTTSNIALPKTLPRSKSLPALSSSARNEEVEEISSEESLTDQTLTSSNAAGEIPGDHEWENENLQDATKPPVSDLVIGKDDLVIGKETHVRCLFSPLPANDDEVNRKLTNEKAASPKLINTDVVNQKLTNEDVISVKSTNVNLVSSKSAITTNSTNGNLTLAKPINIDDINPQSLKGEIFSPKSVNDDIVSPKLTNGNIASSKATTGMSSKSTNEDLAHTKSIKTDVINPQSTNGVVINLTNEDTVSTSTNKDVGSSMPTSVDVFPAKVTNDDVARPKSMTHAFESPPSSRCNTDSQNGTSEFMIRVTSNGSHSHRSRSTGDIHSDKKKSKNRHRGHRSSLKEQKIDESFRDDERGLHRTKGESNFGLGFYSIYEDDISDVVPKWPLLPYTGSMMHHSHSTNELPHRSIYLNSETEDTRL